MSIHIFRFFAEKMCIRDRDTVADIFNGRIIIVDKNFRVIKDTFGLANQKMYISEDVIKCFMGENSNRYNKEKHYFALTVPIYDNTTEKNISGVMAVTASTENILDLADRIAEKGSFFQMIVFWILVLASMGAALFLLRPFQRLQRRLDRIADGNLEEELPADSYKETAGISSAVERTLTKLKAVDQSRQEFVSNVDVYKRQRLMAESKMCAKYSHSI